MQIIEVVKTVLPVALMLGIGAICRRHSIISREGVQALKNVAVNIALPAVLLNAFATTQYTFMDIIIPLLMFGVCLTAWFLGRVSGRLLRMPSRFVPFLTTGFEAGMLGYALFSMLYGADRVVEFARIDLGQVLFVFTLYKILLSRDDNQKTDIKYLLRDMVKSPIIAAIVAGVLIGATGLYQAMTVTGINTVFDACTSFISAPTSAIILLTIGYDLVFDDIPWAETVKVTLLRIVIMFVLRTVLLMVFGRFWPQVDLTDAVNVMFILPPPFVLPVFADDPEQRAYVSSVLSLSTLVAIAGFAVLAALKHVTAADYNFIYAKSRSFERLCFWRKSAVWSEQLLFPRSDYYSANVMTIHETAIDKIASNAALNSHFIKCFPVKPHSTMALIRTIVVIILIRSCVFPDQADVAHIRKYEYRNMQKLSSVM